MNGELKLFSGRAHPQLATRIADYLDIPLGKISITDFPDGEVFAKIEEDVRGRDVFLVQPTCPPVNDNLMELLVMIDSFKRASVGRITAVIPYYGYARQDRKDVGRVPITAKLVANLIEKAGVDRVVTMDLHSGAIQGFFDVPVDHLLAAPVIDGYFLNIELPRKKLIVVSPDEGAIKRCIPHQERLADGLAIVDKRRASATRTDQANLIGSDMDGKIALLIDDMITTGGSIVGAAEIVKRFGAREIYVCATHPVLCGDATRKLKESAIDHLIVCDTIPVPPEKRLPNMKILSVAPLLGEAIKRIFRQESVSMLFGWTPPPILVNA
jgi:ribose-phosphate pyrophosphokinase